MRKTIIAGNWKMNKTASEAVELANAIKAAASGTTDVDIVVCPAYVCLAAVAEVLKGSNVKVGAQDLHWEAKGAYTGKISVEMLKSVGVEYVLVGHSEQRTYFNETDETVNKKTKAALDGGLTPIVCIGETLEEREQNKTNNVVETQTKGAYAGLTAEQARNTVIAYEPVWAIGTGLTATAEQAQEVHDFIRNNVLKSIFDDETAASLRIQYGGSMKGSNAKELLEQTDIDGGLIGGASLKAEDFKGIFAYQ